MNQSYCLNLHERYAPEWGVWECARELFANAKDAAPDGMSISSPNANTLEIYTPTVPDIAELFIIGCGSKAPGDESIGQFGEGLKLAALAATRKPGGSLTVRLPDQTISFSLKDHFGQQVLFADVAESEPFDGCQCTLTMEGAGFALNGKIIEGKDSHTIPKDPSANSQIFCKGIWICALDERDAVFSYNLNNITLNRDRSHAEPWSIRYAVGSLLTKQMNDALAGRLVKVCMSWESDKCLEAVSHLCPDTAKQLLADAFFREYGDKAVLRTDPRMALQAKELGYEVVAVGEGLLELLHRLVPTDISVLSKRTAFEALPFQKAWQPMHAELDALASILDFPDIEIQVFADRFGDLLGKADSDAGIIWLNERLFHADNRFERVRTFIHELAHLQSGGADASVTFESSLDLIGGKLAMLVLDAEPVEATT